MGSTVLVEVLDSHGRVAWRQRIALDADMRILRIGRSAAADITLDDEYVAAVHATVEIGTDGRLRVSDLGSINGIVIGGRRVKGADGLELSNPEMQIGKTRLRLRTGAETLAPEKPDHQDAPAHYRRPLWLAVAGLAAYLIQAIYAGWLGAPRDLAASVLSATAVTGAVLAGWIGVWALLSRVMQGEWRWLVHIAICIGAAVVYGAVNGGLDLATFMLSLPHWSERGGVLALIALGVALFLHLAHASSLNTRHAALIACVVPAAIGGGYGWLMSRYDRLNVNHIEAGMRIYPPTLRLRAAGTGDAFFKSAAGLRQAADDRLRAIQADDPETGDEAPPN